MSNYVANQKNELGDVTQCSQSEERIRDVTRCSQSEERISGPMSSDTDRASHIMMMWRRGPLTFDVSRDQRFTYRSLQ
jgi:hypothetical protein